jgi:hypothetical protein
LFSICLSANLDTQRLPQQPLERGRVPGGGPELELGVAVGADLQQRVFATVVQLHSGQSLGVAAIEAFGQSQNGGERFDDATPLA